MLLVWVLGYPEVVSVMTRNESAALATTIAKPVVKA